MGLFEKKSLLLITFFLYQPFVLPGYLQHTSKVDTSQIVEFQKATSTRSSKDPRLSGLRSQILFLFSKKRFENGLQKYKEYRNILNEHDFPLLREMSLMILENGVKQSNENDLVLSLIGIEIAHDDSFLHHFSKLLQSRSFPVQAKALSILRNFDTDETDIYLQTALNSDFIPIRLEALSMLVQKHQQTAIYQVESLMNKIRPEFKHLFVDFFALAGSPHSITVMKNMLSSPMLHTKLAAILSCQKFSIEELIPYVRKNLSDTSPLIQEAALSCLGSFRDTKSISKMKYLCTSKHEDVKLAAIYSLYKLGLKEYQKEIISMAKEGNQFAISLLANIPESKKDLRQIYFCKDNTTRINAGLALLAQKESISLPIVQDLLLLDSKSVVLTTNGSFGHTFSMLKLTPLSTIANKQMQMNARMQTLQIQHSILSSTIDLPDKDFFSCMDIVFKHKRNALVPLAISLIENKDRVLANAYLEKNASLPGAPFIRACCQLALWKRTHDKKYEDGLNRWVKQFGSKEMIRFTKNSSKKDKKAVKNTFKLSLEEQSHLLIQAFLTICQSHEKAGLDCIIDSMIEGHEKNLPVLAGVVLKTIQ